MTVKPTLARPKTRPREPSVVLRRVLDRPPTQRVQFELTNALDQFVLKNLPLILTILVVLYVVDMVRHAVVLGLDAGLPLICIAGVTALSFWLLRISIGRQRIEAKNSQILAAAIALVVLVTKLINVWYLPTVAYAADLVLLILGVGSLLVADWMVALLITTSIVGWLALLYTTNPSTDMIHFGYVLFGCGLLALLTHDLRVRTLTRVEALRFQEEAWRSQFTAALSAARDEIAERERVEVALRESEGRLRFFVENAPAAVAMFDREMRYMLTSRRYLTEFHLDHLDIIGQTHFEVFRNTDDRWRNAFARTLTGEVEKCEEDLFERPDGSIDWIRWETYPWRDNAGEIGGLILFIENITERKSAKVALQAAKEAAESASRAKSEFLANMSHEVRTPMAAVLGYTEMLVDPHLPAHDRQGALHAIRRNGHHLLQIINDILDLSKIEAGRLELERIECSPWLAVREVVASLTLLAQEKGLELSASAAGQIPRSIRTDPTRLRQVLVNLVNNAIKFTKQGRVQVRLSTVRDSAGVRLRLEVEDDGVGIAREQQGRLFMPFAQADSSMTRRFGGTGLGLSISKTLVRAMGGTIGVASEVGRGSTFWFELPLDAAHAEDLSDVDAIEASVLAQEASAASLIERRYVGRVLLAEDSKDNQQVLSYFLRSAGLEVEFAENGRIAVEKATSRRFDAVLMDMQMPEMDGYQATAELRRRGYQAPIVAVTAHAMQGDAEKCLQAGCTDFLTKPVERRRLISVLCRYVQVANLARFSAGEQSPYETRAMEFPSIQEQLAGDEEFLQLVAEYVAGMSDRALEIRTAIEEGRVDQAKQVAHQLKGSGGMYGYFELSESASLLEDALLEQQAPELVVDLLFELERTIERIQETFRPAKGPESQAT